MSTEYTKISRDLFVKALSIFPNLNHGGRFYGDFGGSGRLRIGTRNSILHRSNVANLGGTFLELSEQLFYIELAKSSIS